MAMENANKTVEKNLKGSPRIYERRRIQVTDASDELSNLCVARNSDNTLVGSEKGAYLLSLERESVVSSYKDDSGTELKDVPTVIFNAENCNLISLATDNIVLCYDIRQSSSSRPVLSFKENSDEINQLSSSGTQLAACDDSGEVKIYDIAAKKLFRTLRNKHKNICSTVCFRSSNTTKELLSGSLDCQLILWDYSKIKVLFSSSTQEIFQVTDGDNLNYMVNPPLINVVDCTDDGQLAACGLGNGSIILYEVTKGRKLKPFNILSHHSSLGTSCLEIIEFRGSRYLLSGGNDCKVNIDGVSLNKDIENGMESELFCSNLQLPSKINHLTAFSHYEKMFSLVCDQSSEVILLEISI